jgi:hypothetical protein
MLHDGVYVYDDGDDDNQSYLHFASDLRFLILLYELMKAMQVDNERFITMNNLFGDENRTLARSLCAKTKT